MAAYILVTVEICLKGTKIYLVECLLFSEKVYLPAYAEFSPNKESYIYNITEGNLHEVQTVQA